MSRNFRTALTISLLCLSGVLGNSSVQSSVLEHERLRIHNNFKTPEEVVAYYAARDASGFVWSGLLESERTAFTFWADVPQQDSFYIARQYVVLPSAAHDKDHAKVQVRYTLLAVGDAHGTRSPAVNPIRTVTFDLKKQGAVWKIVKPDFADISPVVLDSKFPTAVQ